MSEKVTMEAQHAAAGAEGDRLRAIHETQDVTARELYWQLLTFLEKRCPAVFIQLSGRKLYDLLRKGSQPVSAQVLREYREKASERMAFRPEVQMPDTAREQLGEAMASIWASALASARPEAESKAEARNQALLEQIAALEKQNTTLLEAQQSSGATQEALVKERDALLATVDGLTGKLEDATTRVAELERAVRKAEDAHAQAQAEFTRQVDEMTAGLEAAKNSYEGAAKRHLLAVEDARQETARVQAMLQESLGKGAARETALEEASRALVESQRQLMAQSAQMAKWLDGRGGPVSTAPKDSPAEVASDAAPAKPAKRKAAAGQKTGKGRHTTASKRARSGSGR
jgi:hypothetical protein